MMPSKLVSLVLELRGLLPESGCMCAAYLHMQLLGRVT